jgi:hypothetical protein
MISLVFCTKSGSTSIFYLLPGLIILYVTQNCIRFGSQICRRLQANDCLSTAESTHFVWSGLGLKLHSLALLVSVPHLYKKCDIRNMEEL